MAECKYRFSPSSVVLLMLILVVTASFVAALLHPVFFTSNASRQIDVRYDPATGECEVVRGKLIKEYMSVPPAMGIAIPGQPEKQVSLN